MTIPTAHDPAAARGPLAAGRRFTTTGRLFAAGIAAAALLAGALLALAGEPAPGDAPRVSPVRVTSGSETATGFAIGRDRVVTVAHAVDGAVKARGMRARVLRVDRRSDLALLAVRGIGGSSPAVGAVHAGAEVRVLRLRGGRSRSLTAHVRRAFVAHVRAPGAERALTRPALELAAGVEAGDSGAPVLSSSGALAGVIFATSNRRTDTAYAVDASALTRLLARD